MHPKPVHFYLLVPMLLVHRPTLGSKAEGHLSYPTLRFFSYSVPRLVGLAHLVKIKVLIKRENISKLQLVA